MSRTIRQCALGGLALWLVVLSGIVYPQLTAHAAQHTHHDASTHTTALCSWLCIAADDVESTPVQYVTFLEQAHPVTELHLSYGLHLPSRVPPLL